MISNVAKFNPFKGTSSSCKLKMEGHPAQVQESQPSYVVHGHDPVLLSHRPLPLNHRQMIMTRHLHCLQRHFGLKFGLFDYHIHYTNSKHYSTRLSRKQEPAFLFYLFWFQCLRLLLPALLTTRCTDIRGRWRQRQHGGTRCEIGGTHRHVFNPFLFKVQTAVHFNFASSPAWRWRLGDR